MNKQETLKQLVDHFGLENLISRLPQNEVREVLKLVTPHQLASKLGLTYHELRWRMNSGEIPHPSFRLIRRAYFTQQEAKQIQSRWRRRKK